MGLRDSNIAKLQERQFDALIVGGGINGSVTAAALAGQGMSVALIDRGDFASSTSQESSNLAWGGIKYLESMEFPLVWDLCRSRNRLMENYPSSVKEVRFFTIIDEDFRHNRFTLYAGAWLYWLMGRGYTRTPQLHSRSDLKREESCVLVDHSAGGFEYSDSYLMDNDARFVFNFIRTALAYGCVAANYVESRGAEREGDLWTTKVADMETGLEFSVRSRVLINACGPYVDEYNRETGEETTHHHVFSKGIHLIVNRITPHRRVLTFFASDGRLFFMIPMGPRSCIGTTDTRVTELPARVTPEDRRFVLDNINNRLDLGRPLTEQDIIAERCGVRPLVVARGGEDKGGDWTTLSRKHAVELDRKNAHISVFGGKLTDCLNIGEEVAELLVSLGLSLPQAGRRWYGEPAAEIREEFFYRTRLAGLDSLTSPDAAEPISSRFWRRYGESAFSLLEEVRADETMAEPIVEGLDYLRCEIRHAARHEMIVHLEDFLRRRSKIALVFRKEELAQMTGFREVCRMFFGEGGDKEYEQYFSSPRN